MSVSMVHMLFIISMVVPSAGIMVHFMPLSVMAQLMWHIIGIMVATGALDMPGMVIGMGMDIGIDMADFMVCFLVITNRAETITARSNTRKGIQAPHSKLE